MGCGIETIRTNDSVVITIPTDEMNGQDAEKFISFIELEFAAQKSAMTENAAFEISEDINSSWWAENKERIISRTIDKNPD